MYKYWILMGSLPATRKLFPFFGWENIYLNNDDDDDDDNNNGDNINNNPIYYLSHAFNISYQNINLKSITTKEI
jgi:hypothetical protein